MRKLLIVSKKMAMRFLSEGTLRKKIAKIFYFIMPGSALAHKGSVMNEELKMAAPNKSNIITQGKAVEAFIKSGVTYWKCEQTGTIFSKPLDQSNKVGGGFEVERNNKDDNIERIQRIKMVTGKPNPKVLDYGCGNGMLVKAMNENGCEAIGYDAFNPEFDKMAVAVDCVVMIEVVEHLSHPFKEFSQIYDSLLKGGRVYIETSFADWLTKEDPYISPEAGHSTIFTHKGLDMLMQSKGFKVLPAINRNVRLYEK
jgi:hypothetical protein